MDTAPSPEPAEAEPRRDPAPRALFLDFLALGAAAFRGTAVVERVRRLAVERRRWIDAEDYAEGAALCELVPGANGLQNAAWVGWRTARLTGALSAAAGFILPAAAAMLLLSWAVLRLRGFPAAAPALGGLRAAAVGLLAHAVVASGRTTVRSFGVAALVGVAALAFLAGLGPFQVVVTASLIAALVVPPRPPAPAPPEPPLVLGRRELLPPARLAVAASILLAAGALFDRRLDEIGFAVGKVEWLSFGGAFGAVPPLVHEAVLTRGWLDAGGFLDGLALALATPGPTALAAGFVGLQAAGIAGALMAMAIVFVPTLLIPLLAEPWYAKARAQDTVLAGFEGARAAVLGMLLTVTVRLARDGVAWAPASQAVAAAAFAAALLGARPAWIVAAAVPLAAALGAWMG